MEDSTSVCIAASMGKIDVERKNTIASRDMPYEPPAQKIVVAKAKNYSLVVVEGCSVALDDEHTSYFLFSTECESLPLIELKGDADIPQNLKTFGGLLSSLCNQRRRKSLIKASRHHPKIIGVTARLCSFMICLAGITETIVNKGNVSTFAEFKDSWCYCDLIDVVNLFVKVGQNLESVDEQHMKDAFDIVLKFDARVLKDVCSFNEALHGVTDGYINGNFYHFLTNVYDDLD